MGQMPSHSRAPPAPDDSGADQVPEALHEAAPGAGSNGDLERSFEESFIGTDERAGSRVSHDYVQRLMGFETSEEVSRSGRKSFMVRQSSRTAAGGEASLRESSILRERHAAGTVGAAEPAHTEPAAAAAAAAAEAAESENLRACCGNCGTEYDGEVILRAVKFRVPQPGTGVLGMPCFGGDYTALLDNVYAYFPPGKLSGIMGPSGSGKTTLVNQIGGRIRGFNTSLTGDILLDGHHRPKKVKRFVGFCEQNDVLPGTLTVRQALWYAAQLKLPERLTDAERWERVEEVMEMLSLQKIANQKIGPDTNRAISGGQAKRVSIALEVIGDPPILLADEPTNGQDTRTAYSLCQALQNVAHIGGQTVIATIHQPSVDAWALFDNLVLLAAGRVVYCGRADHFQAYLMRFHFHVPSTIHITLPDYFMAVALEIAGGSEDEEGGRDPESGRLLGPRQWKQRRAQLGSGGAADKTDQEAGHGKYRRSRIMARMTRERSCTASNMDSIAAAARRVRTRVPSTPRRWMQTLFGGEAPSAPPPEATEEEVSTRPPSDAEAEPPSTPPPPDVGTAGELTPTAPESPAGRDDADGANEGDRHSALEWAMRWEASAEYTCIRQVAEMRAKQASECGLPYAHGEPPYTSSWWRQFSQLTGRAYVGEATSPTFMAYRLILVILVNPAGLATMFWPALRNTVSLAQHTAAASFVLAVASCMAIMRTSVSFLETRALMYRERSSGAYWSSAHYLSTVALEEPFNLLTAIVFTIIDYWSFGYRANAGAFFFFFLIVWLATMCAVGFGQALSAIAPDITFASAFGPVVYMTFAVMGGYLLPQDIA